MFDRVFAAYAAQSAARLVLALSVVVALTAAAEAAAVRFVSSNGSDTNNCLAATPCRTLRRGVDVAPAGGEVIVRDSGSYGGSLTITKSITISADGVTATLSNPGSITIDGVGAVVALRGLHLQGAGPVFGGGIIGVAIGNAAKVRIEHCTIERFAYYGINLVAYDAELFVADSVVRSNGSNGLFVEVRSKLTVDNSRFEDNGNVGIDLQQVEAVISRTVASRNGLYGIAGGGSMTVISTIAAQNGYFGFYTLGQMTLEFSAATGNDQAGLRVGPSGKARISNSTFTNNGIGLENGGGIIETRQNNTVRDNGTNVVGALTIIPGT